MPLEYNLGIRHQNIPSEYNIGISYQNKPRKLQTQHIGINGEFLEKVRCRGRVLAKNGLFWGKKGSFVDILIKKIENTYNVNCKTSDK